MATGDLEDARTQLDEFKRAQAILTEHGLHRAAKALDAHVSEARSRVWHLEDVEERSQPRPCVSCGAMTMELCDEDFGIAACGARCCRDCWHSDPRGCGPEHHKRKVSHGNG